MTPKKVFLIALQLLKMAFTVAAREQIYFVVMSIWALPRTSVIRASQGQSYEDGVHLLLALSLAPVAQSTVKGSLWSFHFLYSNCPFWTMDGRWRIRCSFVQKAAPVVAAESYKIPWRKTNQQAGDLSRCSFQVNWLTRILNITQNTRVYVNHTFICATC